MTFCFYCQAHLENHHNTMNVKIVLNFQLAFRRTNSRTEQDKAHLGLRYINVLTMMPYRIILQLNEFIVM